MYGLNSIVLSSILLSVPNVLAAPSLTQRGAAPQDANPFPAKPPAAWPSYVSLGSQMATKLRAGPRTPQPPPATVDQLVATQHFAINPRQTKTETRYAAFQHHWDAIAIIGDDLIPKKIGNDVNIYSWDSISRDVPNRSDNTVVVGPQTGLIAIESDVHAPTGPSAEDLTYAVVARVFQNAQLPVAVKNVILYSIEDGAETGPVLKYIERNGRQQTRKFLPGDESFNALFGTKIAQDVAKMVYAYTSETVESVTIMRAKKFTDPPAHLLITFAPYYPDGIASNATSLSSGGEPVSSSAPLTTSMPQTS